MSELEGQAKLQRRLRAIKDNKGFLRVIQHKAVAEAKALVPRRTAFLARSIQPGSLSHSSALVLATAPYAAFVELGTRPHVIRPRNRKVLAWPAGNARLSGRARSGGRMRFAKVVHHPGTKAQPFLLPGAERAVRSAGVKSFIDAWNNAA